MVWAEALAAADASARGMGMQHSWDRLDESQKKAHLLSPGTLVGQESEVRLRKEAPRVLVKGVCAHDAVLSSEKDGLRGQIASKWREKRAADRARGAAGPRPAPGTQGVRVMEDEAPVGSVGNWIIEMEGLTIGEPLEL